MKQFNVLTWDFNHDDLVEFDILPYFIRIYNKSKTKPKTFEEFKKWVTNESKYQFWARCEYEIIITGWPQQERQRKIDVHQQIMMNIDLFVNLLMDCANPTTTIDLTVAEINNELRTSNLV